MNRMKLLEKQKEQKSRQKIEQPQAKLPLAKEMPTAVENFTVVVQNESRIIQTSAALPMDDGDKKPSDLIKVVNKNPLSVASNASLARKVLVKNAMDSLNTPKVTDELNRSTDNKEQLEVKSEPTAADDKESGTKAKPTVMSLAMFAKKTPKLRATILANYVKKYRSQGFVSKMSDVGKKIT